MHVDGVVLSEVEKLLQSLIDEDDADQSSKGFLCEASDVADQRTGVRGHQEQTQEGRPQTDAGPQGQVGQLVVTGAGLGGGQSALRPNLGFPYE